jgi:hypothetical protein
VTSPGFLSRNLCEGNCPAVTVVAEYSNVSTACSLERLHVTCATSAILLRCMSPEMARNGLPAMSAIRSLTEVNRTSCGQPISVENDPEPTLSGSRYLHLPGKIGVVFRRKKSK